MLLIIPFVHITTTKVSEFENGLYLRTRRTISQIYYWRFKNVKAVEVHFHIRPIFRGNSDLYTVMDSLLSDDVGRVSGNTIFLSP